MSEPLQERPRIVKWTRKIGLISTGHPNIPKGSLYYMGYQRAAGTNKHSGPCGRRHTRFYQGHPARKAAK